ncbi:hypothetical protein F2P81_004398, partial [Scophthalmus maximus]
VVILLYCDLVTLSLIRSREPIRSRRGPSTCSCTCPPFYDVTDRTCCTFQEQTLEPEGWAQSLSMIVVVNRFTYERRGGRKKDEKNRRSFRVSEWGGLYQNSGCLYLMADYLTLKEADHTPASRMIVSTGHPSVHVGVRSAHGLPISGSYGRPGALRLEAAICQLTLGRHSNQNALRRVQSVPPQVPLASSVPVTYHQQHSSATELPSDETHAQVHRLEEVVRECGDGRLWIPSIN